MNIKDRGSKRGSTLKKEVHKLLKFKDLQILFFYFCGETGRQIPAIGAYEQSYFRSSLQFG